MLNKPLIPFDLNCKMAKGALNKEKALKGAFFRSCGNFVPSCTYLLSRVLALWMSLSWSAEILSGRSWAEAEARRQAAARASTEAMVRMAERERCYFVPLEMYYLAGPCCRRRCCRLCDGRWI